MKRFFSFVLIVILFSSAIISQEDRPSVALVLAGGGARGFAHIPVIELIEELGIPIDMVIGTSAGAIMGGMYCAGYSGKEIADVILNLSWTELFNDTTDIYLEDGLGSHSAKSNLFSVNFTDELGLDLGKGFLTGQKIYEKLKCNTAKIPSYIHFDSLITPFRATAVDLVTGELVVFEQGDLAEVIRASMSIPGVFEPFPIADHHYMDGFTRNNLPIRVAKDLGYDIIIAVELTSQLAEDTTEFDSNPVSVLKQVISLQQVVVVEQEYKHADLVLYPDIYDFSEMDYNKAHEIYSKGKIEAHHYTEQLLAIRDKIFPNIEEKKTIIEKVESKNDEYKFSFYRR